MSRGAAPLGALLFLATVGAASADVTKRSVPDYDGRGAGTTSAGEVALWIPRILVSPLYLVSELVLRGPLGWVVTHGERHRVPQRLIALFTTDDGKFGFVPTFYVDLGFRPAAGLYVFADDLGVSGNAVRLSAALGPDERALTVTDRWVSDVWRFTLRGAYDDRDDRVFHGIGPLTRDEDRVRFGARATEGSVAVEAVAGVLRARVEGGVREVRFHGADGDDPDLGEQDPATFPAGYAEGHYASPFGRATLVLEGRRRGTGPRISATTELGDRWMRSAFALGGTVDVHGTDRRVSLGVSAALVEPLDGGPVPFTELVTLGGSGELRGFVAGRLRGESAVAATLSYDWPVWVYPTGVATVQMGNVFGERFDDLDLSLMRISTGFGLRTNGAPDHRFELLVAVGTESFDEGAAIDSLRVVVGGSHTF